MTTRSPGPVRRCLRVRVRDNVVPRVDVFDSFGRNRNDIRSSRVLGIRRILSDRNVGIAFPMCDHLRIGQTGFEPATSPISGACSTIELLTRCTRSDSNRQPSTSQVDALPLRATGTRVDADGIQTRGFLFAREALYQTELPALNSPPRFRTSLSASRGQRLSPSGPGDFVFDCICPNYLTFSVAPIRLRRVLPEE